MSDKVFQYKGFIGSIEADTDELTLSGKLLHINGLVTYTAESLSQLKEEFEISVDEYLDFCREEGLQPEKPFSGSFNVRLSPEMHRKSAQEATISGISLNEFMCKCVELHFHHQEVRKRVEKAVTYSIVQREPAARLEFDFSQKFPIEQPRSYGRKNESIGNH